MTLIGATLGDVATVVEAFALPIGAIGGILAAYWARASRAHAKSADFQSLAANVTTRNNETTQGEMMALIAALRVDNDDTHKLLIDELSAVVPRGKGDRKLYDKVDDISTQLAKHVEWEEGDDGKYQELQREILNLKAQLKGSGDE